MYYILFVFCGYIFGNINPAYLISKKKGFDIRQKGSNNPGASNATITMGARIGILVGVCDILKAFIPAFAARIFFPEIIGSGAVAGAAAVIGHIFPVFMKFKGGKGFAPFLGMALALNWEFFLMACAATALITYVTDYIVFGTFTVIISYPLYIYFVNHEKPAALIVAAVSAVVLARHYSNIKKLLRGEEIGLRKSKKHRM